MNQRERFLVILICSVGAIALLFGGMQKITGMFRFRNARITALEDEINKAKLSIRRGQAATEQLKNRVADARVVVGRVPLFYYVVHLYLLHLAGVGAVVLAGRPWGDMILSGPAFLSGLLSNYGYGLSVVYAVWLMVVLALFPICYLYNGYKSRHRDRWWLSYL